MTSTDDLQRRYDRLRTHHDALLAALKDTTGFQFYRDGVAAALDVAESVQMHATWGPDATPDDGLKLGLDGVKEAVRKLAKGIENDTAGRLRASPAAPSSTIVPDRASVITALSRRAAEILARHGYPEKPLTGSIDLGMLPIADMAALASSPGPTSTDDLVRKAQAARDALKGLYFSAEEGSPLEAATLAGAEAITGLLGLVSPTPDGVIKERGEDAGQELSAIREMLLEGQGDDDGGRILPDFQEDMTAHAMVAACVHLLERRRDALDGYAAGRRSDGAGRRGGIYTASKTRHADRWKALRAAGWPIISTWIDEAGVGETACFTDLWRRCVSEAAGADAVLLYREPGDTLKGALVEAGAALASGVPVYAIGCEEFSFAKHALWTDCASVEEARFRMSVGPVTEGEAPATTVQPLSSQESGVVDAAVAWAKAQRAKEEADEAWKRS